MSRRILLAVTGIVSALAIAKGGWMLFELLRYDMNPVHHGWDGAIYTAVGRGILNGLTPYRDLFETKPPGMFLISALSLWTTGSIALANVLQGMVEMVLVLLPIVALLPAIRGRARDVQGIALAAACLFSLILTQYMGSRAGHFQTESFGSVAVGLFALLLIFDKQKPVRFFPVTAGALLAIAIGLKEPFLLVAIAVTLLLESSPKRIVRGVVIPLIIALILGTIILAVLGYLNPYLTIYLPEMMQGRLGTFQEPAWLLMFLLNYPLGDVAAFSMIFAISIVLLFAASLMRSVGITNKSNLIAASGVIAGLLVTCILIRFVMKYLGPLGWNFGDLFPIAATTMIIFVATCWFLLRKNSLVLLACARHLAAVLLTVLAAGMGGFLQQQYGFGIAPMMILFVLVFSGLVQIHTKYALIVMQGFCIMFALTLFVLPSFEYGKQLRALIQTGRDDVAYATSIDKLMSDCGFDRYLMLGEAKVPYALTLHSPYGPGFTRLSFQFPVEWRNPPIEYLQNTFRANIETTPFIIAKVVESEDGSLTLDGTHIPEDVQQKVATSFTPVPPACAKDVRARPDQLFLFRVGAAT